MVAETDEDHDATGPNVPRRTDELVSLRAMLAVFDHSQARLAARLVLLALADHADDDGENAWPKVATIQAKALLGERTVQDALRELERAGEIERTGTTPRGVSIWKLTCVRGAKSAPLPREPRTPRGAESAPDPALELSINKSGAKNGEERARRWLAHHADVTNPEALDYMFDDFGVPPERRAALLDERKAA